MRRATQGKLTATERDLAAAYPTTAPGRPSSGKETP